MGHSRESERASEHGQIEAAVAPLVAEGEGEVPSTEATRERLCAVYDGPSRIFVSGDYSAKTLPDRVRFLFVLVYCSCSAAKPRAAATTAVGTVTCSVRCKNNAMATTHAVRVTT